MMVSLLLSPFVEMPSFCHEDGPVDASRNGGDASCLIAADAMLAAIRHNRCFLPRSLIAIADRAEHIRNRLPTTAREEPCDLRGKKGRSC